MEARKDLQLLKQKTWADLLRLDLDINTHEPVAFAHMVIVLNTSTLMVRFQRYGPPCTAFYIPYSYFVFIARYRQ